MGKLHLQNHQDISLHFQNLLACISLVADSNEFFETRRVYLLVFAGDEQRGDTDKLELVSCYSSLAQVSVDKIHCHEQSLWNQPKLDIHIYKPINQYRSHLLVDIQLSAHVPVSWEILALDQVNTRKITKKYSKFLQKFVKRIFVDFFTKSTILRLAEFDSVQEQNFGGKSIS